MCAVATWAMGSNSNKATVVGENNIDAGFGFGVAGAGGQAGVLGNSENIGLQGNGGSVGTGVVGSVTGGGLGVRGTGPIGVEGVASPGGVGVHGIAMGDVSENIGVLGEASGGTTNLAGKFIGDVQITGTLSKGGGSFKIDHPVDPENKYLYHSFVESPDMMNVYNGNITTDASGLANVELPTYFMALNQDFRYQLTVIGTFAQAIVSEEVSNNRFVIKTNEPSVKVSWQVTGIRKDPYAEKNRIHKEVDKAPNERGLYLHPEAYGQPKSKSIGSEGIDAVQLREVKKLKDVD
jgi:hypothetical protein